MRSSWYVVHENNIYVAYLFWYPLNGTCVPSSPATPPGLVPGTQMVSSWVRPCSPMRRRKR